MVAPTRAAAVLTAVTVLLTRSTTCYTPFSKEIKSPWELRMSRTEESSRLPSAASAASSNISSCPFSKTFPRYRIDFTPVKDKEQSFSLPLLSNIQSAIDKSKFCKHDGRREWMEGQDGVEAYATLWRFVANLSESESVQSMSFAFPNSSKRLLQRFIDVLKWSNGEPSIAPASGRVDATLLDDDSSVPAVRLTRVGESSRLVNEMPIDPSIAAKRTQAWVKRILVDMSICPFTKAVTKSGQGLADLGVPVGRISYDTSNALPNQVYNLMADTWESIQAMLEAGPSGKEGVSSILLAAPAFDDDFDVWAGPMFAMLEAGVIVAGAEKQVGVVCFHPRYCTPDGKSWPGFGHMHSVPRLQKWLSESDETSSGVLTHDEVAAGGAWQRRTPHATINVLRADQLEIAEKRRTTGNLYTENICKLVGKDGIGSAKLAECLERERRIASS